MYVCICNGITDRDVRCAIREKGACSVAGVHRCMGTAPMCGKCSVHIRDMVAEETAGVSVRSRIMAVMSTPVLEMAGGD